MKKLLCDRRNYSLRCICLSTIDGNNFFNPSRKSYLRFFFSTNGEEKHQKFKLQVDQIQCSESKWIVFKAYNRFSYFWGYFQVIKCTHSNSGFFSNKIILLSKYLLCDYTLVNKPLYRGKQLYSSIDCNNIPDP